MIATTALKASDGFTRLYPSVITCVGYAISFYCLAQTLRLIPMGIVYAIWSGAGIVAISIIGYLLYKIGRASCRETSVSVRVDLGGRRIIKNKRECTQQ